MGPLVITVRTSHEKQLLIRRVGDVGLDSGFMTGNSHSQWSMRLKTATISQFVWLLTRLGVRPREL